MTGWRISGAVVWLAALWLLLWNDVSFANVAGGLVIGLGVLAFARITRLEHLGERARIAPLALLHLIGYVAYKLAESNLILAWEIVTPRNRINVGIVAVPLRTDSEVAMMAVANIITLTPGTITIEARGTPPVLYVNVLHLHGLEEVRRDLLRIEELCVNAFGSRAARAQLEEGRQ